MKTRMLIAFLLVASGFVATAAVAAYCPAKEGVAGSFADCTQAKCLWTSGEPAMTCYCTVGVNAASLTSEKCVDGTASALQSRFPGVKSMGVCTGGSQPWGNCLDVMCSGDDGRGGTKCACTKVTSSQFSSTQYVVVGSATCATRYVSSATPAGTFTGTEDLRLHDPGVLDPEIVWLNKQ